MVVFMEFRVSIAILDFVRSIEIKGEVGKGSVLLEGC